MNKKKDERLLSNFVRFIGTKLDDIAWSAILYDGATLPVDTFLVNFGNIYPKLNNFRLAVGKNKIFFVYVCRVDFTY